MKRISIQPIGRATAKYVKPVLTVGLSALMIAMALPAAVDLATSSAYDLMSPVYAAGGQGYRGGGAGRNGGGSGMGGRGAGQGHFSGSRGDGGSDSDHEDSDRPDHAGGGGGKPPGAGTKKGDDFGDLWVILRDDNGVPILNADGYVQPLDEDGNLIPLDDEGHPVNEGDTIEVELGRLNMGRAPSQVLDRAYDEALKLLNDPTVVSIELDPAGRFVVELADGTIKTIDSPLENLAIFTTLLNTGYLPNLTASDAALGDLSYLKVNDGVLSATELLNAASFLAGGADKTGELSIDEVAYLTAVLGIAEMTSSDFVDYVGIGFDYDRDAVYTGDISYYVQQADGTVVLVTDTIMNAVFDGELYESGDGTGIADFTQAADDAVQMIEFIHTQIHTE